MLRGNQNQARASGDRLRLRGAERGEDPKDRDVRGENTEAYRCKDCNAENEGHQERNHDLPTLATWLFCVAGLELRIPATLERPAARIPNLNPVETRSYRVDAPHC